MHQRKSYIKMFVLSVEEVFGRRHEAHALWTQRTLSKKAQSIKNTTSFKNSEYFSVNTVSCTCKGSDIRA